MSDEEKSATVSEASSEASKPPTLHDGDVLDFASDDPEAPMNWAFGRKARITALCEREYGE